MKFVLALALFVDGSSAWWMGSSSGADSAEEAAPKAGTASKAERAPVVDDIPPFSCGAQLRLPNYLNYSLGAPTEDEVTLDTLRNGGYDYAEYMRGPADRADASGGALGAKFRNFRRETLEMYWDDGTHPGMYSGKVPAMGRTATTTYVGHAFKFVSPSTKELVARLVMQADTTMYIIEPEPSDTATLQSAEYLKVKADAQWYTDYYHAHGKPWLSLLNRNKPVLNMWPAESVGQRHSIHSAASFWEADEKQGTDPVALNLTVLSKVHPALLGAGLSGALLRPRGGAPGSNPAPPRQPPLAAFFPPSKRGLID